MKENITGEVVMCVKCGHYFQIGIDGDYAICDLCLAAGDSFPTEIDRDTDA